MTDTSAKPENSLFPSRRKLLVGVAAVAALGGAGLGWRQSRQSQGQGLDAAIWPLKFDTPDGGSLVMQRFRGRPMVLNFWATWCPPCVEELPLLDRFYRENKGNGWQVVGLAIDQPSAVRGFLQKTPVSYDLGMAGLGGTDLVKAMGNLSGGLPFTVVLGGEGQVLQRKMGQVSAADLEAWPSLR